MKITICGSIAYIDKMYEVRSELEKLDHIVKVPPIELAGEDGKMKPSLEFYNQRKNDLGDNGWIWDLKEKAIIAHFDKVAWSNAVLILNYDKNGISGYIGGNTFLEIGVAFYLKKRIYFLNNIPEMDYKEELIGMKPIVINGDLEKIK
ncbi:MAG: hypothetical protein Q8Q23_03365 [bacterium]|nr:hypothetical protein [bacterium]